MDLPPQEDSVLPGFIDGSIRLHSYGYQSLHVEVSELQEHADVLRDRLDDVTHARLSLALNERFFEESNGRIRRYAEISGPAYRSDEVLASDHPDFVHLDAESTLLHGMTLIEVADGDFDKHHEAAFIAEDTETGDIYYFSFWTTNHLQYSQVSPIAETMNYALNAMALRYESLKSVAFQYTTPIGRQQMLQADIFRAQESLRHLISGDDDEAYDVHTDFYYVIPDGMSEDQIDLTVFNSKFGLDDNSAHDHTLTGTFKGVTFPVVAQPNLVDERGSPESSVDIDPYEPCLLFRNTELRCFYAVPRSQLKDVY
jgi:hypothetical protein